MKKTAVFGGSFNPIHNAHIKTLLYILKNMKLDNAVVIPAGIPPHKQNMDIVSGCHRLEMCKLAFEDFPNISVSDIEISKHGISYTCETLIALKEKNPDDKLFLVCGADMFLTLLNWKNPELIFSLASVVTVPRNNKTVNQLKEYEKLLKLKGAKVNILNAQQMTESSTQIRNAIKNSEDFSYMVPKKVFEYIQTHNLYRSE